MRSTSIEAYLTIKKNGLLKKTQWEVYDALATHGPMTQNECFLSICNSLNQDFLNKPSYTPAFAKLAKKGCIVALGERECGVSGFKCLEWDITDKLPAKVPRKPSEKELMMARIELLEMEIARLNARGDDEEVKNSRYYKSMREAIGAEVATSKIKFKNNIKYLQKLTL